MLLGKAYSTWEGHTGDAIAVYDNIIASFPNDFRGYLAKVNFTLLLCAGIGCVSIQFLSEDPHQSSNDNAQPISPHEPDFLWIVCICFNFLDLCVWASILARSSCMTYLRLNNCREFC